MAEDWQSEALCGTDTFKEIARLAGATRDPAEVFFPVLADEDGVEFDKGKKRPRKYDLKEARFERIARATCAECPVWKECLLWHMETEVEPWGIAGRLDASNRSALMDSSDPSILDAVCTCGIKLYGVAGAMPKACSANCRGKR